MSDFQSRFNELAASYSGNDTDIARLLGVTKQAVSNWRNGSRSPRKDTIIQIARVFNVSIEWLMGFDVPIEEGIPTPPGIAHRRSPQSPGPRLNLTNDDLAAIAQYLREQSGAEDEGRPRTPEARILAHGIDQLPREQREQALAVMRAMFAQYADYFKEDSDETT